MLALNALVRHHQASDDDGVAMAMVVASWAIGLIAVTVILATVMFATRTNADNKSNTQAFTSAESGRDLMLQRYLASCALTLTDNLASSPNYKNVSVVSSGSSATSQGAPACASATANTVFVIRSTGVGDDGSTGTVTTTYARNVTYTNRPGGSLSYLAGSFTIVQTQYTGDVVIRDNQSNPWDCNSTNTINGDLWVLNGSVNMQQGCTINGNIYAFGYVFIKAAKSIVTGKIVANGDVDLETNNTVVGTPTSGTKPDTIISGGAVTIKGGVTVNGNVRAAGTISNAGKIDGNAVAGLTISVIGSGTVTGTKIENAKPVPSPTFSPTLQDVYSMTNWMDIGTSEALWGTDVKWETPSSCSATITTYGTETLSPPNTRVGVDYSACAGSPVTIDMGAAAVKHDTVFLVPPTSPMNVVLGGTLTAGVTPTPQLFFIHSDPDLTNSKPDCGTNAATDDISPPASNSVYLMFYTACGVGKHNGNMNAFTGQYYAANPTNSNKWVQPTFTCQAMKWAPLINLGCTVGAADTNPDGTVVTTVLPPALVKQAEQ